ncbi:NUDIX domain-containing protein [Paenibacillus sp. PR3]|uniref:NUDIX domain-containing protein n=1 Tax=Paenibacillus terricola TaxID=2763503 RepID=A0ABR8N1S7_9BACL|nr:NUDIX domain-containing protein [Paenibacillus terricola]MBD3922133.1 NUDIX domain-containing protein [Paenibacillus terricola]
MSQWFELDEVDHEHMKFAVIIATFHDQYIIIHNKKRGGWEIPGGSREPGESIVQTASRELYEETGAVRFDLMPFGIYEMNGSYGMVFYAKVEELSALPAFEIEAIRFEDVLPEGMNFDEMFYIFNDKWMERKYKMHTLYSINNRNIEETNQGLVIGESRN